LAKNLAKKIQIKFVLGLIFFLILFIFARNYPLQFKENSDPVQMNFHRIKRQLIKNPNDLNSHLALSKIYRETNNLTMAKEEVLKAKQYSNGNKTVSNLINSELARIERMENKPQELKTEITKLERISSLYPNYQNLWIKLSILYWQVFDLEKAKFSLDNAQRLDKNSQYLKLLKEMGFM